MRSLLKNTGFLHVSQKQLIFFPCLFKGQEPSTSLVNSSPIINWHRHAQQRNTDGAYAVTGGRKLSKDVYESPAYLYKTWGVWAKWLKRWERKWERDGEEWCSLGEGRGSVRWAEIGWERGTAVKRHTERGWDTTGIHLRAILLKVKDLLIYREAFL